MPGKKNKKENHNQNVVLNMKTLNQLAFEFWCNLGNLEDLQNWINHQLDIGEIETEKLVEGYGFNEEKSEDFLLKLAHYVNGFEPLSNEGIEEAKRLLKNQIQKFLREEIKPHQLCKLVNHLDTNFLDFEQSETDNNTVIYPQWLGDLWNSCDWCDETWTHSSSPHLVAEAEKILKEEII